MLLRQLCLYRRTHTRDLPSAHWVFYELWFCLSKSFTIRSHTCLTNILQWCAINALASSQWRVKFSGAFCSSSRLPPDFFITALTVRNDLPSLTIAQILKHRWLGYRFDIFILINLPVKRKRVAISSTRSLSQSILFAQGCCHCSSNWEISKSCYRKQPPNCICCCCFSLPTNVVIHDYTLTSHFFVLYWSENKFLTRLAVIKNRE